MSMSSGTSAAVFSCSISAAVFRSKSKSVTACQCCPSYQLHMKCIVEQQKQPMPKGSGARERELAIARQHCKEVLPPITASSTASCPMHGTTTTAAAVCDHYLHHYYNLCHHYFLYYYSGVTVWDYTVPEQQQVLLFLQYGVTTTTAAPVWDHYSHHYYSMVLLPEKQQLLQKQHQPTVREDVSGQLAVILLPKLLQCRMIECITVLL